MFIEIENRFGARTFLNTRHIMKVKPLTDPSDPDKTMIVMIDHTVHYTQVPYETIRDSIKAVHE